LANNLPKAVINVAAKYCTECGFANSERRGACLMCYNYLGAPTSASVVCPNPQCGKKNARNASFCFSCGTAIVDGVVAVPASLAIAINVLDEAAGHRDSRDDRIGPADDDYAEEPDMDEEEAAAFEEFKREQAAVRDDGGLGQMADELEEEEFAPPSALTLEQQAMDTPAAQDEDLVPPPPLEEEYEQEPSLSMNGLSMENSEPAAVDEPQDVEEPVSAIGTVPPVPDELTDDALVPPVPADLIGPVEALEPAEAEAEAKTDADTESELEEDGGLGGWSLAFDEEDKEDE
jgi:ribosomal protein L37E